MSRRKSGNTRRLNEREFPHVIELVVLLGSFGSRSAEFETFHRERSIPIRRGRSRHKANQSYVRFCFPDAATADAFQECFGGERLILAPSKPRALAPSPRSKHDRPYSPRVVGSKIMTPADLRRLHKYMLEMGDHGDHGPDAGGGRKRMAGTRAQVAAERAADISKWLPASIQNDSGLRPRTPPPLLR